MIREAKIEDLTDIAKINISSWKTTYADIIDSSFLNSLSMNETVDRWSKHFNNDQEKIFVAEVNGRVVGYVRLDIRSDKNYLGAIYLLKQYQGEGLGKKLLLRGLECLKGKTVYVEVLSDNKSKYFYQKYGAKFYKEQSIKIGQQILSESVYRWNHV